MCSHLSTLPELYICLSYPPISRISDISNILLISHNQITLQLPLYFALQAHILNSHLTCSTLRHSQGAFVQPSVIIILDLSASDSFQSHHHHHRPGIQRWPPRRALLVPPIDLAQDIVCSDFKLCQKMSVTNALMSSRLLVQQISWHLWG